MLQNYDIVGIVSELIDLYLSLFLEYYKMSVCEMLIV